MNAVDTNVLVYVHDPRDVGKQQIAAELVESLEDVVLLWQVACEYMAASRKLVPFGYSIEAAWEDVMRLADVWTVQLPSWEVMLEARRLLDRYSLSFWDALILGACVLGGIERIYSEDLTGYRQVERVEIINPFEALEQTP